MSGFSAVDAAEDPSRLIDVLDDHARGLAAMKRYIATTLATRGGPGPVLDLGCGAGHDIVALDEVGVRAVGVDPSALMCATSAERTTVPLVRADGRHLPFARDAFGGCWIERVLMHALDPRALVGEAVRCVRSGGLIAVFEPDWSSLRVDGEQLPARWVSRARHLDAGAVAGTLLVDAGCAIRDRVEERSWWTWHELVEITGLHASLDRAITEGDAPRAEVDAWLARHGAVDAPGSARVEIVKALWVAEVP